MTALVKGFPFALIVSEDPVMNVIAITMKVTAATLKAIRATGMPLTTLSVFPLRRAVAITAHTATANAMTMTKATNPSTNGVNLGSLKFGS